MGFHQAGQRVHLCGELLTEHTQGVAQAQQQCGVQDVLAGQSAVQPPGSGIGRAFPQQSHQAGHRIAVTFGTLGDSRGIVGADQ